MTGMDWWLIDWLAGWLVECLVGRLVGWVTGRLGWAVTLQVLTPPRPATRLPEPEPEGGFAHQCDLNASCKSSSSLSL